MSDSQAETPHDHPVWRRPMPTDADLVEQVEAAQREHLLLDPRYPHELNEQVLDPMVCWPCMPVPGFTR
jgi:hypothetical protein